MSSMDELDALPSGSDVSEVNASTGSEEPGAIEGDVDVSTGSEATLPSVVVDTASEQEVPVAAPAAPKDRLGAPARVQRALQGLQVRGKAGKLRKKKIKRKVIKVARAAERSAQKLRREASALASAWNDQQLRSGHEIEFTLDREARQSSRTKLPHGNVWTAAGILREAFSSLNRTCTAHTRSSHREVDAMALVSMAHHHAVREFATAEVDGILNQTQPALWLRVQRAFDETPMTLSFGKLYDLLAPMARYWVTTTSAQEVTTKCLTYEEYMKHKVGRQKARAGVLEVMAQTCSLAIATSIQTPSGLPFTQVDRPVLRLPPRIVQRNNSSTLLASLESTVPSLKLSRLGELLLHGNLAAICLDVGGDLAPANQRVWFAIAKTLCDMNQDKVARTPAGERTRGLFLMLAHGCLSHVMHTVTEKEFRTRQLIPNLHATAAVCRNLETYSNLYTGMEKMVRAEIDIFVGARPPAEYHRHTRELLQLTLLRGEYTRGRQHSEAPANMEQRKDVAQRLAEFINGDWTKPRVQHWCWKEGCCRNEHGVRDDEITKKTAVAILGEALFEPLPVTLPACNRWYTFPVAQEIQCAGFVCHRVLPRAMIAAFPPDAEAEPAAPADADVDQDVDYVALQAKKLRKAVGFMLDPGTDRVLLAGLVATTPSTHLSNRLQHLDHTLGSSFGELIAGGLLDKVQRSYFQSLRPTEALGSCVSAQTVLRHLTAVDGHDMGAITDELVARIVGMSAAIYARLVGKATAWPWKLLRSVAPAIPDAEKSAIRREFLNEKECCRDSWFSEPLAAMVQCEADFNEQWCESLLLDLFQTCKATNMQLENLLAKVKQSVPFSRTKAHAEKLMFAGHITQLMQDHTDRKGIDPRSSHRAKHVLDGAGGALKAPRKRVKKLSLKTQETSRCLRGKRIRFINAQVHAAGPANQAARREAFRAAAKRWHEARGGLASDDEPDLPLPDPCDARQERYDFSGEWPLREDVLHSFYQREGHASISINKASQLRWSHRNDVFVPASSMIPEDQVFVHRFSCQERHPGLCYTRHADIYKNVNIAVASMERWFTEERKYKFFMVLGRVAAAAEEKACVYFAHSRARRPHAQVTHVMASVSARLKEDDASAGDSCLAFETGEQGQFTFQTLFHLVVPFLERGVDRLMIKQLPHTWRADLSGATTSVTVAALKEGAQEVFPTAYKPERHKKPEPTEAEKLLDSLDATKKKPAKKKKPGLKGCVGMPSLVRRSSGSASSSAPAAPPAAPAVPHFLVPEGEDGSDASENEPDGDEEETRWEMMPNGTIFIRRSDGQLPKCRDGRLTGPFGKAGCLPHQLNWSMACSLHKGCKLIKTNGQLKFNNLHLIEWLLLAMRPGIESSAQHKSQWRPPA